MMTLRAVYAPAALLALGLALLPADTAESSAQSSSPQPKPETGSVASITVTGCLERWAPAVPDGASDPSAERPPAGAEFVLTSRERETGAAGDAGIASAKRYLLLANPGVNYAAHLRHTVKVVGTITPQPAPGASPEDRAIDPGARETNLPQRPGPESYRMNLVEVSSLEMVAEKCDR